uniref:CX domain-containing protein n=1 Tax=Panagrellus redivivus TaxID=6233 RepID=A0A7E4ZV47_PANRE
MESSGREETKFVKRYTPNSSVIDFVKAMKWILLIGYIAVLAILPCDCAEFRANFTCFEQPHDIGDVYFLTIGTLDGKDMRNLQTVPYNMNDMALTSNDPPNFQVVGYQVWFFFDCDCMNALYFYDSTNSVTDYDAGQVELSEKCPSIST